MANYGYARVSTREQNVERQVIALQEKGVPLESIFIDRKSGKNFDRIEYQSLVGKLQAGDVLFISSLDRLGRNYEEMQEQWRKLTKEIRVDICVINMSLLDTRNHGDLTQNFIADVLQILSFFSDSELSSIRERQAQGIAAAKARGVQFGRPVSPHSDEFPMIVEAWKKKQITAEEAAKRSGLARASFFRHARKYLDAKGTADK